MLPKLILDVDTGGDDAVAILLAGHHPAVELAAVCTTHGNALHEVVLENTLRVLAAGELQAVPVYPGAVSPLVYEHIPADPDQRAVLPLPPTDLRPQEQHAVSFLLEYYHSPAGPETIYVPIGPLTNLALALRLNPGLARRIPRIVTMGGAYIEGNATPSAEFNILADPEAAHIVYSAGIPITMIGLEVTAMAYLTLADVARIAHIPTPWAQAAARLMERDVRWFMTHFGVEQGQIFDANTIAEVIEPGLTHTRPMHVDIELRGEHTRGRTVADISGRHTKPANVDVGMAMDRSRFLEILAAGLSANSPTTG